MIGINPYKQLCEDVELLDGAGASFDRDEFLSGGLTPVYFGSALNNFGVEPFLDALIQLAPSPRPRESSVGMIEPTQEGFSGIVFKIQANMDPQHRDSMAFVRVCSGRFEKDMMVNHPRLKRKVRMTRPHRLFARDRETVDEAYPGDVIGLSNPGIFTIGDTLCVGDNFTYAAIPPFQPEVFSTLRNRNVEKFKQFNKGLEQLQEEGVIQVLYAQDQQRREPILAAVGQLQFDVVIARLQAEYNIDATLGSMSYSDARWVLGDEADIRNMYLPSQSMKARDNLDRMVILFNSAWDVKYAIEKNPKLKICTITEAWANR
jgi:peptide chain release factor 3